jgi:hypothetical protein
MTFYGRLASCCLLVMSIAAPSLAADDGRRAVDVERYGISVRVPQAWQLIDWASEDRAFVLRLPQEDDSQVGYVACEVGVVPESLQVFLDRLTASDAAERQKPAPRRIMTQNAIEPVDAARFGEKLAAQLGSRLVSIWEHTDEQGRCRYEHQTRVISEDTLYTFSLTTDEAHYEAYRLDFEDMLAAARFSPPRTGLQKLPGGYWMQRDFRFAMCLPEAWKPAFAPNDSVLFFATGAAHGVFTDNLLVVASRPEAIDLAELKQSLPERIRQQDPKCQVASCDVVAQGERGALETVVHTQRGELRITVIERRFRGRERNYEVRFTCETAEFERIADALRQSLDTFIEAPPTKAGKQVL